MSTGATIRPTISPSPSCIRPSRRRTNIPTSPIRTSSNVTLTVNVDPSSNDPLDSNDPRNDSTLTTATIAPRPFSVFLSGPTAADQGDTVHMGAVLTDDDATDDFHDGGYMFNWSISGLDGFSESGQQLVEPTKVTDGASFTFPYLSPQAYTVDLTVTDDDGLTESASWVINGQQGLPHVGIEDAGTVPVGGALDFTVYLVGCCDTDVTVGYTLSGGASGSGRVTIPASHTSTDLLVPAGAVDTLTTVTAAIWDPDPSANGGSGTVVIDRSPGTGAIDPGHTDAAESAGGDRQPDDFQSRRDDRRVFGRRWGLGRRGGRRR